MKTSLLPLRVVLLVLPLLLPLAAWAQSGSSTTVTVAPNSVSNSTLVVDPGKVGTWTLQAVSGYHIVSSDYSVNPDSTIWTGSNPVYRAIPGPNSIDDQLAAQVKGLLAPDGLPGGGGSGPPPTLTFTANLDVVKADLDGDTDNDGTISHSEAEDDAEDEVPGMVIFVADDSRPASEWRRPISLTVTRRACRITWTKSSENFLLYADESCTNTTLPTTIAPGATVTIYAKGVAGSATLGGDWVKAECKPTAPVDGTNEKATDQILITVAQVDLVVDSNNTRGTLDPIPSAALEAIEENSPGKIVFVNHNDDDLDGIPDYADLQVYWEQTFVPLLLIVKPALERTNVKVALDYSGEDALPSMDGLDIGNGYRDYRGAKRGVMRLWEVRDPTRDRSAGNYIPPGHEYEDLDVRLRTYFIEGINTALNSEITATIRYLGLQASDTVQVTVVEPTLGVNCNNNLVNNDGMRVGIPDVEFLINADDEVIKLQRDLPFWRNQAHAPKPRDPFAIDKLEDFLPFAVEIPAILVSQGFKGYLTLKAPDGLRSASLGIVQAGPTHPPSIVPDRRAHLKTVADATALLARPIAYVTPTKRYPLDRSSAGVLEFLLTSSDDLRGQTGRRVLALVIADRGDKEILVDQVGLRFEDPSWFYRLASLRNRDTDVTYMYPTEDDRPPVPVKRYDVPATFEGNHDPQKARHLVMLHGYNVSYRSAIDNFNATMKRVFWLGFRGNFVGVTWKGEETQILGHFTPSFDANVENAFETSPAMLLFTRSYLHAWAHGPENIDFLAHSLGNLVMWDTLRLNARTAGSGPLVHNAISVEAAVWKEAFDPEGVEFYPPDGLNDPPGKLYDVEELKQHSWKFWFNQTGYPARSSVAGEVYHSYNPRDFALYNAMRSNDWFMRAIHVDDDDPGERRYWHYYRDKLKRDPAVYRSPIGQNNLHHTIPSLMSVRALDAYDQLAVPSRSLGLWMPGAVVLNLPIGSVRNRWVADVDYLAPTGGWEEHTHADFKDLPFPTVYKWYHEFLGSGHGNQAIPLGQE